MFFEWFISGPYSPTNDQKLTIIEKIVNTLSQNAAYACLTQRQVTNKDSSCFYGKREFPQQLALGLSIHDGTRCKKMIQLLLRMFNNNSYVPPTLKYLFSLLSTMLIFL